MKLKNKKNYKKVKKKKKKKFKVNFRLGLERIFVSLPSAKILFYKFKHVK